MTSGDVIKMRGEQPEDPAARLRREWGERIRHRRETLGWTLAQVAEKMTDEGCRVSGAAVGMWERGETAPRWHHQFALARVLRCEHTDIFRAEAA